MADAVLYSFLGLEALFVIGGIIVLVFAVLGRAALNNPQTTDMIANNLLISRGPLIGIFSDPFPTSYLANRSSAAAIANGVFIFLAFLLCIPSITIPSNRGFLKIHGYAVLFCAVFTLALGLEVWFQTLTTRANLAMVWGKQSTDTQSLLQERFKCCGYKNATTPPFIQDDVCTNALVAANLQGCVGPFSSFANSILGKVFTGAFAIVAVDVLLLLGVACLLKVRKERERYALIDAKVGFGPI